MSPYCVLGYLSEHEEESCSLKASQALSLTEQEPLGILDNSGPKERTPKEDKLIADVKSTGRKRAVQVKPITGQICEWAGLKYAGGGVFPILGCIDSVAKQVHHGANKNTLDNRPSNLHAICDKCHGRWHTLNDPTYPEENIGDDWYPVGDVKPHDSETKFTPKEFMENEAWWATPKGLRK